MLENLFGNQNVVRILYFLFINQSCYATQLKRLLDIPLSPLQKALLKLEESQMIESHLVGKTRVYQFNTSYPLHDEIGLLLKKAYSLLSPTEKKKYLFLHKPILPAKEEKERDVYKQKVLLRFWEKLEKISSLSLTAESLEVLAPRKKGRGQIKISTPRPFSLIFHERGAWAHEGEMQTQFSNQYQWTLDLKAGLLSLEHLRYGLDQPVFLFYLTPAGESLLESIDSHLSNDDTYLGKISWNEELIHFSLRIISPKKNEQLHYTYS